MSGSFKTLEDVFKLFDKDGSGCIDKTELAKGLQVLGCNPTVDEIQSLMAEADSKGKPNGRLEFEEFSELIAAHRITRDVEMASLHSAFEVFDKNNNGYIDKEELREALTTLGFGKLTDEEVNNLYAEVDVNDDNFISVNELVKAIMD